MRFLILGALVALISTPTFAQTCNSIGSITYCSNGLTANQIGGTTYFNDGTTANRIGGTTYFNR